MPTCRETKGEKKNLIHACKLSPSPLHSIIMRYSPCSALLLLTLLFSLAVFSLSGCVAKKPITMRHEGNLLTFTTPKIGVLLKQDIQRVDKEQTPRRVIFSDEKVSPLFIDFFPRSHVTSLNNFNDLKYIAESNNMLYLDLVMFDGNHWARVVNVNTEGYMLYGYISLTATHFVFIYMLEPLSQEGTASFFHYQKTRKISEHGMRFVESRFSHFNNFAEIQY